MADGLRVVRGPDWEWGDQDGGEGYVGTVTGLEKGGGMVIVQWDTGQRCRYRCGEQGKYDLRILDNGPSGTEKPSYISCDWCQEKTCGLSWRCMQCLDYHLCSQCYMAGRHSIRHQFFRVHHDSQVNRLKVPLTARFESKKIAARGIFPGAQVVRGVDWRWGDQDGGRGTAGKVICIKDWKDNSQRSTAEVQWTKTTSKRNVYRVGHHGKVDLRCVEGATGRWYYPDHLPVLDPLLIYLEHDQDTKSHKLVTGDVITLELDIEIVKLLQEDHGGWNDIMAELVGEIGLITAVFDEGSVLVRCRNNAIFTFNPEALTKVDIPFHLPGDVVRVLDDIGIVHDLQQQEIGWLDDMALSLGQVGCVVKRTESGRKIHATVNGKRWIYDAKCLIPAPEEELPLMINDDYEDVDLNARLQMASLLRQKDEQDTIPYAAAAGDGLVLRKALQKYPQEVDRKILGKSSLQIACLEHFHSVLKVVLQYHPDLELMSDGGLRALHICSYVNNSVAAKILLDHGADVNGRASDMQGSTPLMIAAGVGHHRTLKVLLEHPNVDVHAGNGIDSTALYCAVAARRNKSVQYLLEAGSDPSHANFTGATPLHDVVGYSLLPAMEKMIIHRPDLINFTKEDGYSPLHVAAANNRVDIADFLAQQSSCDLNKQVNGDLTALMIAAHEGHTETVELLVGYGAGLNVAAKDGRTALHLVINRKNMAPIHKRSSFLMEVRANLESDHNEPNFGSYLIVACMLVREGAELHIKDIMGKSPFQLCSPEEASVIKTHAQKYSRSFHGSLRSDPVELPKPCKRIVKRTASASMKNGKVVEKKTTVKNEQNLYMHRKSSDTTSTAQEVDVRLQATAGSRSSSTVDLQSTASTTELSMRHASDVEGGAATVDMDGDICCMCEGRIDVKLVPCGHSVMCSECVHDTEAKRCPTCMVPIKESTPLNEGN